MEVFFIALVLLGLAFLGIGIKLILNKNSQPHTASCSTGLYGSNELICGCGTGACGLKVDQSVASKSHKHDDFDLERE